MSGVDSSLLHWFSSHISSLLGYSFSLSASEYFLSLSSQQERHEYLSNVFIEHSKDERDKLIAKIEQEIEHRTANATSSSANALNNTNATANADSSATSGRQLIPLKREQSDEQTIWKTAAAEKEKERQREKEKAKKGAAKQLSYAAASAGTTTAATTGSSSATANASASSSLASSASSSLSSSSSSSSSSASKVPLDQQKGRNFKVTYVQSGKDASNSSSSNKSSRKGRIPCICQATEHGLYTNCTVCGRIICELEGEGPCLFCHSYVTQSYTDPNPEFIQLMRAGTNSTTPQLSLSSSSSASSSSSSSSSSDAVSAGLAAAIDQKNRLLAFAAREDRKAVIDEQSDFHDFESNSWISDEEKSRKREQVKADEQKMFGKREHRIAIDIEKKQVINESQDHWKEILKKEEEKDKKNAAKANVATDSTARPSSFPSAFSTTSLSQIQLNSIAALPSLSHQFHNDTLNGRASLVYSQLQSMLQQQRQEQDQSQHKSTHTDSKIDSEWRHQNFARIQHDLETGTYDEEEMGFDPQQEKKEADTAAQHSEQPSASESSAQAANEAENPVSRPASASIGDDGAADEGFCLSMHQPWASLLVHGIKRFEGRGWYSKHRGRLWIASTISEPSVEEIKSLEDSYRRLYTSSPFISSSSIPFPKEYPKSALLGYVDVQNVLSQQEFQTLRSTSPLIEQSESNYLFVCTNPHVLTLPLRMSGDHKIYRLDSRIHNSARAQVKAVDTRWLQNALTPTAPATDKEKDKMKDKDKQKNVQVHVNKGQRAKAI